MINNEMYISHFEPMERQMISNEMYICHFEPMERQTDSENSEI